MGSFLSNLSNFFMPSAEEGARRRLSTFGTESKLVATGAIVATAAALIAAPVLVTSASARAAVGNAILRVATTTGKAALANPGKATLAVIAAPAVVNYLYASPSVVSDVTTGVTKIGKTSSKLGTQAAMLREGKITGEEFVLNNKEALLFGGLGLATALSIAAVPAVINLLNRQSIEENTQAIRDSLKGSGLVPETPPKDNSTVLSSQPPIKPTSPTGDVSLVPPATDSSIKSPMLPVTKGTSSRKKRRKAKETPRMSQSVRVNITDDRDINDRKVFKEQRR